MAWQFFRRVFAPLVTAQYKQPNGSALKASADVLNEAVIAIAAYVDLISKVTETLKLSLPHWGTRLASTLVAVFLFGNVILSRTTDPMTKMEYFAFSRPARISAFAFLGLTVWAFCQSLFGVPWVPGRDYKTFDVPPQWWRREVNQAFIVSLQNPPGKRGACRRYQVTIEAAPGYSIAKPTPGTDSPVAIDNKQNPQILGSMTDTSVTWVFFDFHETIHWHITVEVKPTKGQKAANSLPVTAQIKLWE